MNTASKVSAFAVALVATFGATWAAGAAVGPFAGTTPPSATGGAPAEPVDDLPPGLAAARNGYALRVATEALTVGPPQPFSFRIDGPDGKPVTRFEVEHEKLLHLVLVRRDGAHYQHLHPRMDASGTWSTPLALPAAGSYRVFADFKPEGGAKTTLGADVQAPGSFAPEQYTSDSRSSEVDGYTVRLDGELAAGAESPVTATVTRDGAPVTDLQPYLGANGHLVALRGADLAYLHVHPKAAPGSGPEVAFLVEVPTTGRYRLFLDFQHGGRVRTAEFTLGTTGSAPPAAATTTADDGHAGHG
ncbi:hypothetical protein [Umezawaea sp.]|uniref:hypothetical protein n=1 Tax=Umezawaea sp. TaxID=1955258 RepID=UPI002ED6AAC5